jgi:hypothetical protein
MATQETTETSAEPLDPAAQDPVDFFQKQKAAMILDDEDPLLISQSLTYVTDDGSILHAFQSSPFSTSK